MGNLRESSSLEEMFLHGFFITIFVIKNPINLNNQSRKILIKQLRDVFKKYNKQTKYLHYIKQF